MNVRAKSSKKQNNCRIHPPPPKKKNSPSAVTTCWYFCTQDQAVMKSMQFSFTEVARMGCTHLSPRLWGIRLHCSAGLPCRQWWICFILMVASSAHSYLAGWQWQTNPGSTQNCLPPGQHTAQQWGRVERVGLLLSKNVTLTIKLLSYRNTAQLK